MVANIFLYQSPDESSDNSQTIRIGPISLTLQQILTGLISSLIAFPINVLIVLMFKNMKGESGVQPVWMELFCLLWAVSSSQFSK